MCVRVRAGARVCMYVCMYTCETCAHAESGEGTRRTRLDVRTSGLKIKGTNPYVISVIFVSLCNPFYEGDPLERRGGRRGVGGGGGGGGR